MNQYLLDTNIGIFYLKGQFNLNTKIERVGVENGFVSEITIAELKFGAENSEYIEKNRTVMANFLSVFQVIPIFGSLDVYAKEKARLKKMLKLTHSYILVLAKIHANNNIIFLIHYFYCNCFELMRMLVRNMTPNASFVTWSPLPSRAW